jgi:hypothetical protein
MLHAIVPECSNVIGLSVSCARITLPLNALSGKSSLRRRRDLLVHDLILKLVDAELDERI